MVFSKSEHQKVEKPTLHIFGHFGGSIKSQPLDQYDKQTSTG